MQHGSAARSAEQPTSLSVMQAAAAQKAAQKRARLETQRATLAVTRKKVKTGGATILGGKKRQRPAESGSPEQRQRRQLQADVSAANQASDGRSLRPRSVIQSPVPLDPGEDLVWDADRSRFRGLAPAARVATDEVPEAGEQNHCSPDSDWEGPSGLRWVNVEELLQSLSGRLQCTACGMADLDPCAEEVRRGTGSTFKFWCPECEEDTFTLVTQRTLRLGKRGPPTFEGNVRLAAHALRTGGGYAAVHSRLGAGRTCESRCCRGRMWCSRCVQLRPRRLLRRLLGLLGRVGVLVRLVGVESAGFVGSRGTTRRRVRSGQWGPDCARNQRDCISRVPKG